MGLRSLLFSLHTGNHIFNFVFISSIAFPIIKASVVSYTSLCYFYFVLFLLLYWFLVFTVISSQVEILRFGIPPSMDFSNCYLKNSSFYWGLLVSQKRKWHNLFFKTLSPKVTLTLEKSLEWITIPLYLARHLPAVQEGHSGSALWMTPGQPQLILDPYRWHDGPLGGGWACDVMGVRPTRVSIPALQFTYSLRGSAISFYKQEITATVKVSKKEAISMLIYLLVPDTALHMHGDNI